MASPMRAVMSAIEDGAVSRADIAARAGLRRETVDAVVEKLEALGYLQREYLQDSCAGGCGGCPAKGACQASQGPVALVLGRR